ncbi:helix-turn-helix domain-containing protein [Thiothrix fructosivorans]|uniref:Helix-turn-helix domain-containing protein n=1 Tax=Thiothrix fructosivorans TaxID=111770 RepID=A0A8B0SJB8_9GAMM|nr:helix-turn-helix domain-containing protein [Thiothrix fructosivorans]MBO0611794.1 helix-turn-helix domain-containing protein [Thiothrix fructosivorans]QTX10550.1 helix-turn-helix domain-containing protein [Thiothrix fructosivorans]
MTALMSYQIPTQEDAALAVESSRLLAACIGKGESACLRLHDGNDVMQVPVKAIRLLVEILDAMARGDAVSLIPIHRELTTQEAANILNVSRPYLVKLIESGEIPFHKNGVRRKVLFKDLMEYKQKRDRESMVLLDELTAEAQELDMGY